MFFQFFQMGQLFPLLLSRHKWCFWKHGEHFLGVDIYWVVQMFLKWKSNSSNHRQTDRVQRPLFSKLRLITMVGKPMSVCHVYILGRRINSFGRNRTKPSVFQVNKTKGQVYDLWHNYSLGFDFEIGHLHDGAILLLRPQSFSFFLSHSNLVIPARFE